MDRKERIRDEIREAERNLQALLDERAGLNGRRLEAEEADRRALSEAHDDYIRATEAGKRAKQPVGYTAHIDEVEARAEAIPTDIDKAELRAAKGRRELARLERAEALAAEKAQRERLERIREEVRQLQEEERQAAQEDANARKRTEAKQQEEHAADEEVHRIEQGLKARKRVSPLHGQIAG